MELFAKQILSNSDERSQNDASVDFRARCEQSVNYSGAGPSSVFDWEHSRHLRCSTI
jgi:hypothetical protein